VFGREIRQVTSRSHYADTRVGIGTARPEQIFGVGAAAPGGGTRMAPSPTRGNPVFLDHQLLGVLVGPPLNEDQIAAI
jgi:hypothetical protein